MTDEKLNPLPVEPLPETSRGVSSPAWQDGSTALLWTLVVALAPIVCDAIFIEVIGGRSFLTISLFHVGLSLFGITLAALVRILGHGRGFSLVPLLMIAAIVEVVIALFFGGTFSKQEVERAHVDINIERVEAALTHGEALDERHLSQIHNDLIAVRSSHPEPTLSALIVLGLFGLFSLFALLRFWSPPTEPERRLQRETNVH